MARWYDFNVIGRSRRTSTLLSGTISVNAVDGRFKVGDGVTPWEDLTTFHTDVEAPDVPDPIKHGYIVLNVPGSGAEADPLLSFPVVPKLDTRDQSGVFVQVVALCRTFTAGGGTSVAVYPPSGLTGTLQMGQRKLLVSNADASERMLGYSSSGYQTFEYHVSTDASDQVVINSSQYVVGSDLSLEEIGGLYRIKSAAGGLFNVEFSAVLRYTP